VSGSCRILDLDFDGDYDSTDATKFDALTQGAQRHPGRASTAASQPFAHQGLLFEPELAQYQNRARQYDPGKRRFEQRDPLSFRNRPESGYEEGMSLFLVQLSNPTAQLDPSGLGCTIRLVCYPAFGGVAPAYHCEFRESRQTMLGPVYGSCHGSAGDCPPDVAKCKKCPWLDPISGRPQCAYPKWDEGFGNLSTTGATVVSERTASDRVCDCLKGKCSSYPRDKCYAFLGAPPDANSNTQASCLNAACDLGFGDPNQQLVGQGGLPAVPGWNPSSGQSGSINYLKAFGLCPSKL